MASCHPPYEPLVVVEEEEDYIDMDISSSASLLCYTIQHSPPHCSRDFEFQMSSNSLPEIDGIISPADELFYKGKLLPLHLPPRVQLLQKLLQDSITTYHANADAPFDANTATATTTTPYESHNISPATSCYVSGELNPEEYCFVKECQKDTKKSWTKKFKSIKQSSLCHKLKAPKAYLKSLFTRSRCSDESSAVPKAKDCSSGYAYAKTGNKTPPGHIKKAANLLRRIDGEKMVEESWGHRRSFSGAIKSCSASSSCSSSNSSSFSSVSSEVDCSILGAIAYCKKSQQEDCVRKSVSDVEFYSLPASRIVADCEKQERPENLQGLKTKRSRTNTN